MEPDYFGRALTALAWLQHTQVPDITTRRIRRSGMHCMTAGEDVAATSGRVYRNASDGSAYK